MYFNNNPNSQLFTGKSLRLGGSKSPYEKNGTFYGDLSAILIDNMPFWAEFSSTPSNRISLMEDWDKKIDKIISFYDEYIKTTFYDVVWADFVAQKCLSLIKNS